MAERSCPNCRAEISAAGAAAYSNGVECPRCHARLEVASGPRTLASVAGLAAALMAALLGSTAEGVWGGVLPVLYAVLGFGIVSALALMYSASMRNAPAVSVPEPPHGAGGHGGGHH